MTDNPSDDRYVPVSVLEGLVDGWRAKISKQEFDGTAEQYRAYMEAHESCAEDIETAIQHTSELTDSGE